MVTQDVLSHSLVIVPTVSWCFLSGRVASVVCISLVMADFIAVAFCPA